MKKCLSLFEITLIVLLWAVMVFGDLFESMTYYPVGGTLVTTTSTLQYSDSIMVLTADTITNRVKYLYYKIDPGFGKTFRYYSLVSLNVFAEIQHRSVDTNGTAPNVRWWIDMKDTSMSSWSRVSDTQNVQATLDTLFTADTLYGYINTSTIKYLPAALRFGLQSDSLNKAILRVSSRTNLIPTYKTME